MEIRREASSFRLKELFDNERKVIKKLFNAFESAVKNLKLSNTQRPTSGELDFRIDRWRRNQVFFLHGTRGTGKTSLLLSFLHALRRTDDFFLDSAETEWKKRVDDLKKRLIFLDPIDLDVLPAQTNLLAALLVRVEKKMKDWFPGEDIQRSDKLYLGLLESPRMGSPFVKLKDVQNDVALAWNGNLMERAPGLDPDIFALEAIRMEEHRLNLIDRISEVLEDVASGYKHRTHNLEDPLFVLPVDDFDLDPMRCLELLEKTHAIRSNRLVLLILGDINIAETVMSLRKADILATAAGKASGQLLPIKASYLTSLALELTANAIRKMIPPSQVFRLELLTNSEALNFSPGDNGTRLRRILESITLINNLTDPNGYNGKVNGKVIKTLSDMLTTSPIEVCTDNALSSDSQSKFAYSGCNILRSPLRQFIDLRQMFKDLVEIPASDTSDSNESADVVQTNLIDLVALETIRAIEESPGLSVEARQSYRNRITQTGAGQWTIDTHGIKWCQRTAIREYLRFRDREQPLKATLRKFIDIIHIESQVISENTGKKFVVKDSELHDPAKGWLILFHDLLALDEKIDFEGELASEVKNNFSINYSEEDETELHFHTPRWSSFWQAELFENFWEKIIDIIRKMTCSPQEKFEFAAFNWLSGCTALCSREKSELYIKTDIPIVDQIPWHDLSRKIETFTTEQNDPNTFIGRLRRSWLIALAINLSPEMGLQDNIRDEFKWLMKHVTSEPSLLIGIKKQRNANEKSIQLAEVNSNSRQQLFQTDIWIGSPRQQQK